MMSSTCTVKIGSLMTVDTPFVRETFKADGYHGFVECLIPDSTGLFHAVEAFVESSDPVRSTRIFKARRLLHENSFCFR